MFCIKCGETAEIENFCSKCFLDGKKLFKIKKPLIYYCDNCGSFHSKGEKYNDTSVKNLVLNSIESDFEVVDKRVKTKIGSYRIDGIAIVKVAVGDKETEEKETFLIHPKRRKCDACVKILGGYHEAVIQVRGEKKELILRKIKKLLEKEDIAIVEEIKEGYNVKITKKPLARKVVAILRDRYGIKESYKLVGEKKGKKLYRNFYSVR